MRTTELTANALMPVSTLITLTRDEPRLITVLGAESDQLVMTIGLDAAGDPLIEIPGTGQIEILPETIQTLTEGREYRYNIWRRESGGSITQLFMGAFTMGASIAPMGVDAATTFLSGFGEVSGISRLVTLTLAEYQALPAPDPTTLYIVR